MTKQESIPEQPVFDWRIKLGIALFILSIALPLLGIPAVGTLELSATLSASISGVLLVAAEVLGLVAIAVMGKSGYAYIKSRVFGVLKRYGPPAEVSRLRYTIGLVMFSVPLLFGWVAPYASILPPALLANPLPYAIAGDLLLLVSLFVLGGDFWDKIRALFIHSDKIYSSNYYSLYHMTAR